MHKTELIDSIAAKSGLPKAAAAKALEATLVSITEALVARDSVTITGFGVFKPKERPQREGDAPGVPRLPRPALARPRAGADRAR